MTPHPIQPLLDTCTSSQWMEKDAIGRPIGLVARFCLLLFLGLYLAATALAAMENWHHSMHDDEGDADHQCLVTHLQSGDFSVNNASDVPLFFFLKLDQQRGAIEKSIPRSFLLGWRHGRAPPQ